MKISIKSWISTIEATKALHEGDTNFRDKKHTGDLELRIEMLQLYKLKKGHTEMV